MSDLETDFLFSLSSLEFICWLCLKTYLSNTIGDFNFELAVRAEFMKPHKHEIEQI